MIFWTKPFGFSEKLIELVFAPLLQIQISALSTINALF